MPETTTVRRNAASRMAAIQAPIVAVIGDLIRETPGTISLGQGVVHYGPPSEVARAVEAALSRPGTHQYNDGHGLPEMAVIVTLGNGFIMTSMIWTSAVVAMVDGRLRRAAAFLLAGAALAVFGIIHSVHPQGGIYLPWTLDGLQRIVSWQFVGAYVALAVLLLLLSLQRGAVVPESAAGGVAGRGG